MDPLMKRARLDWPESEAAERIGSANLSDLSFALRCSLGPSVEREDVRLVAKAIDSMGGVGGVTPSDLRAKLEDMGRSAEQAAALADALFK